MWKKRISLLLVVLVTLSLLTFVTGCSSEEAAEPAPCPEVNEEEIIKEAAMGYFNVSLTTYLVEVEKAKDNLDSFHVIDIRPPDYYAKGHVPGAKNIPMTEMGKAIPTLPTDKPLLIICNSGQTSGQTISLLRLVGFDALSLKGGTIGWTKFEPALPVEK